MRLGQQPLVPAADVAARVVAAAALDDGMPRWDPRARYLSCVSVLRLLLFAVSGVTF